METLDRNPAEQIDAIRLECEGAELSSSQALTQVSCEDQARRFRRNLFGKPSSGLYLPWLSAECYEVIRLLLNEATMLFFWTIGLAGIARSVPVQPAPVHVEEPV
jgi:hypothetical protein